MRNALDFFKIMDGDLGAINFNNMILVTTKNYTLINYWLNENYIQVSSKAFKLYDKYINGNLSINVVNRCCNFKLLEAKCIEYKL